MIQQLLKKFGTKETVRGGLIGAGAYGTAIVTQSMAVDGLVMCVVADVSSEKAKKAYEEAGISEELMVYCKEVEEAENAIRDGKFVYTDQSSIVGLIPSVDIICESTGIPEESAKQAVNAIKNKKHIAMVTKDCDACIGPVLKKMADDAGVIYTPVDGDQHGLLIQIVEWAKSIGLDVICAGKATDGEFVYDEKAHTVSIHTDKKVSAPYQRSVNIEENSKKYFDMIPEGKTEEYINKRREALKKLPPPGSYDLCEMVIAANYTGLKPAVDTLYHAPLRITEIPVAYNREENGGLLKDNNIIDLVTCLHTPSEAGLGGGVFMVVKCDNAYSNYILTTKGQVANYDNSAAVIYRPYHLCGVETPYTLLVAGKLGINTASAEYYPHYDVVRVAEEDIKAGETFGNDHSTKTSARIVPASVLKADNPIEAHLLSGNRAKVDIPKGTVITAAMVEEPEDSVLWNLRRKQDEFFLSDKQV